MTKPKKPTKPNLTVAQQRLRLVWLAGRDAEIRIPFASKREAVNFRLRLYKLAKPFRQDREWDPEFFDAIDSAELVVQPSPTVPDGFDCVVRPSYMDEAIAKALEAIGQPLRRVEDMAEAEREETFRRLAAVQGFEWQSEDKPSVDYEDGKAVYDDDD